MAEQQLTQEQLGQEQLDGPPMMGPEPKPASGQQMFSAMEQIRPIKEKKVAPAKEPKVEPVPATQKQEPIQFFESPAQKIERQVKEEMAKEPDNLSWLASSFDNFKSQDTRYSDFTPENRMKIQGYRDAFQNKNSEIKRHQKVISNIVANTTEDADINELVQVDVNGNKFLNKEKLRRIVTDRVQKLGGNNIVADYVYSKAAVAAEDKFQLNNQKTIFDNKLKTAKIAKPKDADIVEKEFKDIELRARGEMKNAQETVNMDFISEANRINDKYAYSVNQVLASAPYPMSKAIEDARSRLTYENIDETGQYQYFETQVPEIRDEDLKQRANELFQANNEDYLTTQYLPVIGQMQDEVKSASRKYNNILNRKKSEIQATYEKRFSEMKAMNEKAANDYNTAIGKLWDESGVELQNDYERKMKATYDSMGMGEAFGRKFVSAAGNMLYGIGAHLRANGITGTSVDFLSGIGQYANLYNNTYKPSIKDAYLSPKFWAGGVGEMLGSSAVIAATTIATRNPFIGGIISNLAEGSSMAGTAYDNQLMKGKDPVEASNSASGVLRMNMLTMPLNALQAKLFMPFTKGAGFTGAFKKTTLGAVGGTIEEMGQATFEEGEGFKPKIFYAPQTLEMGLEVFGSQFLMGVPGGAVSGLADNIRKNKKIASPVAQVATQMVRKNGPSRIDAVAEVLNISGEIDEQQAIKMKEAAASIAPIEAEASALGIEGDKKDAYIGLSYDISELEKQKQATPSESGKGIIDRQISDKKQQIADILDDKVELASVTIAGAKIVAPVEEVSKIMDTEDFAKSYDEGAVKIETKNPDLLAKEEQIKAAAPTRRQNIISDTGEIIGQVPAEAAPVTEAAPAVPISTSDLFSQLTADEKDAFTNDVLDAVASFKGVTSTNKQGEQLIQAAKEGVRKNPVGELDKAISRAEEVLNKAKAEDKGDFMSSANIEASQNALNNLNQIKQKYATQISERAQQEGAQPSNLVQRTGTQEGQPQVGQAEGGVGQTTQQAADTRNRNIGSQAQQIAATTKALDEKFVKGIESTIPTDIAVSMAEMQIPDMDSEEFRLLREDIAKNGIKKPIKITFYRGDNKYAVTDGNHRLIIAKELGIKNIPFEINESFAESKSAFPYAEYPEIYPSAKNPSKSLEEISSEYAKAKADGSNPELVKAVEDLIGQPAAPMEEAAPVTEDFFPVERAKPAAEDVSKRKAKLGIMAKANKIEDIDNPRDRVMAHFVSGKNININSMQKIFGGKDDRIRQSASFKGEINARKFILSKNGPTIDELANMLWEQYGLGEFDSYDTRDYRNAIEEVLLDHTSRASMAKELNARYTDAAKSQDLTEEEISMLQEQEMSMLMSIVAGIDEDVKGEILNLLETYTIRKPTGSEIDWRKLEEDSNGFEPAILNLSEKSQNIIDEILKNPKQFATGNISAEGIEQQKQQGEAAAEPTAQEPIQGILTADTRIPSNLEKVYNFLDGIDKAISRELGTDKLSDATRVIPLATAQLIVKGLKRLVKGGMSLQKAITEMSKKYKVSETDAVQALNVIANIENIGGDIVVMSAREYMRDSISNQIRAIGKVKDRAEAIRKAVSQVVADLKKNFGADFKMSAFAVKQLNKSLFDAVFSRMDDATAIDEIIAKVTPIVEYAAKRQLLTSTAKLLDKVKSNYKSGRYSGAARLSIMENFLNADARKWLKSEATIEDISIFNEYLKELTGKKIDTTNLDAAIALSNQFVPSPQQSTIIEKDSLNNKIKGLIRKAANNQIDFADYPALVSLERAINDINERKGALTGLTQQEQDEIMQNYNDLIALLPKPIDQLIADAQAQIDADVKNKVGALGTAIETSQEFRDSIENPLLYEAVLRFRNEMTDDFINSLTPKEKMLLSANIDEILRGNPNSVTYEFSAKAGAFRQSNINYKFGKDIFSKRQLINNNGVTGLFGKVRRLFMDVDYNRASAERMAASFDLFRFHLMDAELNTGVDEFGMGVLERDVFAPIARAIDSAFNKVTESLSPLQEALKLLNDKSNRAAIKKGIGQMNKELGTGFFGGKTKWMHMKNLLGYGNTFYMEVSTRMATIVATQIDHISNLEEGESAVDVVLLRNILDQKAEDYDGRTMKEHYQTNPSAITDMTDEASLFDHIAYGILTNGGVNKLSDLSKEELLNLLTDSQKQAIAKWREHIDNTKYVVEAAMIMKGGVTAFLNEYFPRRVYSKDGVGEIKDIQEYLSQAGANVGVDSGQLKSRKGEVGRLDLNGNSVLYNNLKDIYLIHEVKPVLDSLKGLDVAVDRLKKERELGAATYAEAISIAVASRVKNALQSNERIANNNYTFTFRLFSKVSSLASRVILISQLRQAFADFFSNITKLSAALGFANRSMKNQIMQVVSPKMSSYTTDKGTFKWDDYVKIALATGSSVHRIMSVYADNFLYEFSKPKEQLQREQRVAAWQDMAVKKHAWMSRFEEAFNRITGEYLDHQAFADERGAYRAIYSDAVQRASEAADSFIDRQYGLASIARQPVRIQVALPFVGRAARNLFGKSPTIARDNPASVVLGFLSGYPSVQFQLFSRYMRSALSMDRDISAKQRTEDIAKALTEVIVPSVMYNVIRAATATMFTTTAAAVMAAGDDEEDRKRLYKEMENMPFWKRWFTKTRIAIGEKEQKFVNAVINGMMSSTIDPNVNAIVRPVAGLFLFKAWKENVIEDMTKTGKTRSEIQETKQKIKEYEDILFETYSIRPIEVFGTKEYQEGIKRYYSAGAQSEGLEDLIKSTGGFGILYNEVSRSMDLAKLIDATDENKNLSESELFAASALKLGGLTFANVILGGKFGATLSMFSGDMNKVANMIISDQKSIQTGFEIQQKKKGKKSRGTRGSGTRGGGVRGGGTRRSGTR